MRSPHSGFSKSDVEPDSCSRSSLRECPRYVGTDLSDVSIERLQRLRSADARLAHVELDERTADRFEGWKPGDFDLILLNSVIQYFPDGAYLQRVLAGALRLLAPGGHLFVGDVRDLRLQRLFARSLARHSLGEKAETPDLEARAEQIMSREEELLVDPRFFAACIDESTDGAAGFSVHTLLKRGRAVNELTRFRYDVLIRKDAETPKTSAHSSAPTPLLIEWPGPMATRSDADSASLREWADYLRNTGAPEILIRGIPNPRLQFETTGLPAATPSFEDWFELAKESGRSAHAALSTEDALRFDLALTLAESAPSSIHWPTPASTKGARSKSRWTNTPLRVTQHAKWTPVLRAFLAERLPEYMVPAVIVWIEELPLTPNGKTDRRGLPEPDLAARRSEDWTAPRTETEAALAAIWSEVTGLTRISATDHFFEIGGHSLLATQVISRVRESMQVEVPLRILFEHPTLDALAAYIDTERAAGEPEIGETARRETGISATAIDEPGTGGAGITPATRSLPARPIPRADRSARLPLSLAQQRLWFIDRLEPGNTAYLVPNALRLRGALDRDALDGALSELLRRHEPLRTRFLESPEGAEQYIDTPYELRGTRHRRHGRAGRFDSRTRFHGRPAALRPDPRPHAPGHALTSSARRITFSLWSRTTSRSMAGRWASSFAN